MRKSCSLKNYEYEVHGFEKGETPVYSYKLDRYSTPGRGNSYILTYARLEKLQQQPQEPKPASKPLTNKEIEQKIAHCEVVREKTEPDTGKLVVSL